MAPSHGKTKRKPAKQPGASNGRHAASAGAPASSRGAGTEAKRKRGTRPTADAKSSRLALAPLTANSAQESQATAGGKRGRQHQRERAGRPPGARPGSQNVGAKRKRAEDTETARGQRPPERTFQHLRARTRHIPQDVIASKWASLPQTAQDRVKELFRVAKRPVVLSRGDDRRRMEAESTLDAVVRRLEKRLPKMPFPPGTGEAHFDLEKLIERNRLLEGQLTPAMHSVDLLQQEVEREEQALERDRADLAALEANAKAERGLAAKTKKAHPLLRRPDLERAADDAAGINLAVPTKTPSPESIAEDADADADLAPLLKQLESHLQSMETNSAQIQGVDDAMRRAHAALDGVLFAHGTSAQYEHLTTG